MVQTQPCPAGMPNGFMRQHAEQNRCGSFAAHITRARWAISRRSSNVAYCSSLRIQVPYSDLPSDALSLEVTLQERAVRFFQGSFAKVHHMEGRGGGRDLST